MLIESLDYDEEIYGEGYDDGDLILCGKAFYNIKKKKYYPELHTYFIMATTVIYGLDEDRKLNLKVIFKKEFRMITILHNPRNIYCIF